MTNGVKWAHYIIVEHGGKWAHYIIVEHGGEMGTLHYSRTWRNPTPCLAKTTNNELYYQNHFLMKSASRATFLARIYILSFVL